MVAAKEQPAPRLIARALPLLLLLLAAVTAPAQAHCVPESRDGEKTTQTAELLLSPTPQMLELQRENEPPRQYDASDDSFAPKTGQVVRNKLSKEEAEIAQKVVNEKGGTFSGQTRSNTPGIDGHLNGNPAQLKGVSGTSPTAVSKAAKEAGVKAANAGETGVEAYIDAPNISAEAVLNGPVKEILKQQSALKSISVLTKDGWVHFTR